VDLVACHDGHQTDPRADLQKDVDLVPLASNLLRKSDRRAFGAVI
jgi:hypothetical protein